MEKLHKNDTTTFTEEIFVLLDNGNSDVKDDIDEVLNVPETDSYVKEEKF